MFRTNVQTVATAMHARQPVMACDVAVVGGGLAGLATALRLQAAGLSTVVLEAHGHAGGCAGYYRRRGFSFDVGATTLVDFEPGGVGAQLLDEVGAPPVRGEALPGYTAWLPDRVVHLHRDRSLWHAERTKTLGASRNHLAFWSLVDTVAASFWRASRNGVRLPMRRPADAVRNLRAVGVRDLPLARHAFTTLGQTLRRFGLRDDKPLAGLLSMLVEDTVHATLDDAPLINAALGVTIRGAGLTRHAGGMHGFFRSLVAHYRALGGHLRVSCEVHRITGGPGDFIVHSRRTTVHARQVVCAIPAETAARVCVSLPTVKRLARYVDRDRPNLGGAIVAFLGVPDEEMAGHDTAGHAAVKHEVAGHAVARGEVAAHEAAGREVAAHEMAGHAFTHHQLLQDYDKPLGNGNNMFVSVSAPGDELSAPAGHRAVMISTHTTLAEWADANNYAERKKQMGEHLVELARRVYPNLGQRARLFEVGTPRTYERFAWRPGGAVGGAHQSLRNTNQHAVPHDLLGPGVWLVGDSTWPGLGTVACVLGSRIVAEGARRWSK